MFLSSRREITDNAQHPDPQHRVRCGHRDQLTPPDRIVCHQGGARPRPVDLRGPAHGELPATTATPAARASPWRVLRLSRDQ